MPDKLALASTVDDGSDSSVRALKASMFMTACYAPGPAPMESNQVMFRTGCRAEGCDRFACEYSEPGFAEFCCRACAEAGSHHTGCDKADVYSKRRVIPGIDPIRAEAWADAHHKVNRAIGETERAWAIHSLPERIVEQMLCNSAATPGPRETENA